MVVALPDQNVSYICVQMRISILTLESHLFYSQVAFTTSEDCCTEMVPWVATSVCVAESMPPFKFAGTGKWYVSYPDSKCVQDCPSEDSPVCGGVVSESHITLFDDPGSCCAEKLFWIPIEECQM